MEEDDCLWYLSLFRELYSTCLAAWISTSAMQMPSMPSSDYLLVPAGASQRQCNDPEVSAIVGRVERYNRLFGRCDSSLFQRMRDLPFLLRRLLRELMDPQRSLPLLIRARVYFAVKEGIELSMHPVLYLKSSNFEEACGALEN
ncbi:hypothetical protein CK203_084813 [Vitis vinifera]|uniref:Uncharacterized protein n=1 Tax=Vitis vinifera TaxID=29760 RepID=A0A438BVQ3_VITVI|nr:hypothetical protein CK203_084813 [Vitis vinifera]